MSYFITFLIGCGSTVFVATVVFLGVMLATELPDNN